MISVVIVDDHPLIRSGLKSVLGLADDINIVAEGCSGSEAIRAAETFRPDVLILDVNLPDMNGAEAAQKIRSRGYSTAILVLTVQDDAATIMQLLENGANGYVLKDEAGAVILQAIHTVARGETWLSPRIAKEVVNRAIRLNPNNSSQISAASNSATLSIRELEILRMIAQGLTNEEIAGHLFLTPRTIQNHVSIIYSKLGVTTRTAAALYAIRNKLIDL